MLRVVFSFTVKRVLEHGYRHVGHRIVERLVWIEPIKLYTRTHCETVAPFNYFTSTGICQPRYQLSVTRVTRVIAVPSFLSFFPSLSLSLYFFLSLALPQIYVFIRSMATLHHRDRIDICTTNRTREKERYRERRFANRSSSVSIFSLFFFFFFFLFVLQISTSSES